MGMDIRPARSEDADAITAVARASWSTAYEGLLSTATIDAMIAEWYDPDDLADSTAGHPCFLVAVADAGDDGTDEVIAFASARPDGDAEAILTRIYARPDRWGGGAGSTLLSRVAETLTANGIERLRAVVLAENEVGRAFYDARGFDRRERRPAELDGETVEEVVVVADAADLFE